MSILVRKTKSLPEESGWRGNGGNEGNVHLEKVKVEKKKVSFKSNSADGMLEKRQEQSPPPIPIHGEILEAESLNLSSGSSGSTGSLSSGGSSEFPLPKNIRFHYHHKDGTKNGKRGRSECSTVYSCPTLRNARQLDFRQYQQEEKEGVAKRKELWKKMEAKERNNYFMRVLWRLIQIKDRTRRKEIHLGETLENPLEGDQSIKRNPSINPPGSDELPEEIRRNRTLMKVVMAQHGIATTEISRTTQATAFIGPLVEGVPGELRSFQRTDRLFLRHRHCTWESKCCGGHEENIFQILNSRGHKLMLFYGEPPSPEKLWWKSSTEYSGFDPTEDPIQLISIKAKTIGIFPIRIRFEVYAPGGVFVGSVEEKRRFWRPRFHIKDAKGRTFAFISRRIISSHGKGLCQRRKSIFVVKTYGGVEWGVIRSDWIDLQNKLHSTATHFGIKFHEELDVVSKTLLTAASILVYVRYYNGKIPRREIPPLSPDEQELTESMTARNPSQMSFWRKTKAKQLQDKETKTTDVRELLVKGSFFNITQ